MAKGGQRAEDEGEDHAHQRHPHGEPERLPDIVAAPGDGEPFEGEAGRREVEAAVVVVSA
jgi:hypothetical protein